MAKRNGHRQKSGNDGQSASLRKTFALAFLLVNFILWGVAASLYNKGNVVELPSAVFDYRGELTFVIAAVTTLPQLGSVVSYVWTHHKWYVAVSCVVEALLLLFIVWMRKIEQDLNSGRAFGKRKR